MLAALLRLLLVVLALPAGAHPFGSTFYGHLLEVRLSPDRVEVRYRAEVPTPDLLRDLRRFLRGVEEPGPEEQEAFVARWLDDLEDGLVLYAGDRVVPWRRLETEERSGVGDTRFIRFFLHLEAELPEGTTAIDLVNGNVPDVPSIFRTVLYVDDAVVVDDCSLFRVRDGRVVADRDGRWRMDEEARELRVAFHARPGWSAALRRSFRRVAGEGEDWVSARDALASVQRSPLDDLVTGRPSPGTVAAGLVLAVVLGALHALSPGHGKALVAAYLLGTRRSIRRAVQLGLIVTVTHTAGVYALAAAAWLLEEVAPPEVVLPWMNLASGLLVLGVGAGLVVKRWRAARRGGPGHGHGHGHGHVHAHDHAAGDEEAHARAHAAAYEVDSFRDVLLLGVSGGLAPCPSALVLLLTALSFHRLGLGLVLVLAFSAGLALLVTAIGVAVVLLGDRFGRTRAGRGPLLRWLPVGSAVVVLALGVLLSARGVAAVVGGAG